MTETLNQLIEASANVATFVGHLFYAASGAVVFRIVMDVFNRRFK